MILETVRVEHDGFPAGVLINRSDFDQKVHALFGSRQPHAQPDAAKATETEAVKGATGAKKA